MQFPSHASGDVVFGPDGYLYASAGDGASFDTEDWGQAGNPCGDPADEGGSLRSQDIRTSGDPLSISGAIFRINKANGNAPNGSTSNADRIVTVGQRNPWRMTFRPGTSELWSGDVGGSIWEEVNRTDMALVHGPGQPRLAVLRGQPHRLRAPAWLGLARQARVREPVRRGRERRAGAVLQLPHPRRRAADTGRELPAGDLVGLGHRVHPHHQHLPGRVPRLDVLQRLRARLHLAAGQAAQRRPRPELDPPVRRGGRDPGRHRGRPRRRPLLRRLRHRGRRPDRRRGRHPPDHLHDRQPAAGRRRDGHAVRRPGAAQRVLQRGRLDRPGRRRPDLRVGAGRRRGVQRRRRRHEDQDLQRDHPGDRAGTGQ